MIKHKHNYSFLYKYVALLACLCLVFAGIYTLARYSTKADESVSSEVEEFDVSSALYEDEECTIEVNDLVVDVYSLSEYTGTYYLKIINRCNFAIGYELSINEPFIYDEGTAVSGTVHAKETAIVPLYISVNPSADLSGYGEYTDVVIGLDIYQGEAEEVEVDDSVINFTVALENTGNSSDKKFYIDGVNWDAGTGDNDDWDAHVMNTRTNETGVYTYDRYYDFGKIDRYTDITFSVSPDEFESDLYYYGLTPTDDLFASIDWDNDFHIWANQFSNDPEWVDSMWGFNFSSLDTSILPGGSDFTVVLKFDFNDAVWDYSTLNNIVTDYYFILNGTRIERGGN